MPTLSSSLVKHQVASMEDVEEALARQAQYGGDLVTNLLELRSVSEEQLTRLLAESNGLEPAPVGELPRAPDAVRRLVPGELAQRYAFYPLDERDGALSIAVSEPLPGEVESDMAFSLGVTIVQRLAPLVRVREALARDYGVPLEQRMERVLSRLGGQGDLNPSAPPAPVDAGGLTGIRPATLAPPEPLKTPVVPKPTDQTPTPLTPPAPAPEPEQEQEPLAAEEEAAAAEARPEPEPEPEPESTPPSPEAAPQPRPTFIPNLATLARREPPPREKKRLGPYTAAMAEEDLLEAESRDDVLHAFIDFAAQFFEYAALFAVHGDLAEGRDASGPGASRAKLSSIGVPLDLPSTLSKARDSAGPLLVTLGVEGLDVALAKDLERRPGRLVLLLPVRVRSRCVLILYGDHGDSDVRLTGVGDVISFAPLVSAAIERLIIQRKRPGSTLLTRGMAATRIRRPSLPSITERAQALAGALEVSSSIPPALPSPRNETLPPSDMSELMSAPLSTATFLSTVPPSFAPHDLGPPDSDPPASVSTLPPEPESEPEPTPTPSPVPPSAPQPDPGALRGPHGRPSVPAVGPRLRHDSDPPASIEEALSSRRVRASTPAFDEETGTQPNVGGKLSEKRWKAAELADEAKPAPTPAPPAKPPAPTPVPGAAPTPVPVATPAPVPTPHVSSQRLELVKQAAQRLELVSEPDEEQDEVVEELTDDDVDSTWAGDVSGTPSSRTESHSAIPLTRPAQSSELKLPSVIVDLANDCRMLVDQLLTGDETAGDRLVDIGTTAVTVLVSSFPGPLKPRSMRPGSEVPKASECGPILRTLRRLGHKSAPFVAVRTNDTDPLVRHWATLLLGELPGPESVHAVARRFFDTDEDVRRAALNAAKMFLENTEVGRAFVAEFGSIAQDPNKGVGMRLAAVEALAELRHPLCVPELIHVLPLGPNNVTQAATRALTVVARQDFHGDGATWTEWWRANGGRHRIEWLIDALTHESQDIRRPAGEELKALTREYFGYYDDLPPRERERAQMRYREWWETRGKARFH